MNQIFICQPERNSNYHILWTRSFCNYLGLNSRNWVHCHPWSADDRAKSTLLNKIWSIQICDTYLPTVSMRALYDSIGGIDIFYARNKTGFNVHFRYNDTYLLLPTSKGWTIKILLRGRQATQMSFFLLGWSSEFFFENFGIPSG